MDWEKKTIETYDNSAERLAEYFRGVGARTQDIEQAISLRSADGEINAVEIGCGDGRDAKEIIPRVSHYIGVDPSMGLLDIARQSLPEAKFVLGDALSFNYPEGTDIVFAFASLLHVPKADMPKVLAKISHSLKTGGILYISLKERAQYEAEPKLDEYGERMFYYYNPTLIKLLADNSLVPVLEDHQQIGHTDWFTLALKKI